MFSPVKSVIKNVSHGYKIHFSKTNHQQAVTKSLFLISLVYPTHFEFRFLSISMRWQFMEFVIEFCNQFVFKFSPTII